MPAPIALWFCRLPEWCRERSAGVSGGASGGTSGGAGQRGAARAFQEPSAEDAARIEAGLGDLPAPMAESLRQYVQAADRARGLALRLLVRLAVADLPSPEAVKTGHSMSDPLDHWHQDRYGRPYVPGLPRFNATHSGRMVALAIRWRAPGPQPDADAGLGLDVEAYRPVDFRLMEHYMRPREWTDIQTHPEPRQRFFHYWTAKEALMKAEGLGFHLPLEEIDLQQGQAGLLQGALDSAFARIRGRTWILHRPAPPATFGADYALHLACPENAPQLRVQALEWPGLLDAASA